MHIAMVSNYPPKGRPVSEYCFHLVEALRDLNEVSRITVLADSAQGEPAVETFGKVAVLRCWNFDSYLTLWKLLKTIGSIKPDVCWFNITLGSFGMTATNFPALLAPMILERLGMPTLVTLHNIVDLTDVNEIKFRGGKLAILGARIATWLLCRATLVCVLLSEYESVLREKYGASNVQVVPLGTLGLSVDCPNNSRAKQLLCFGIFGTHKKLETTLEAMRSLHTEDPTIKLIVVGGSNAHSPDYLRKLQERFGSLPNVEFRGYIPEDRVPDVFRESAAMIMSYRTIGGESATLVQAGMYSMPVLVSDLPLFRRKAEDGYALNFFDVNDPESIRAAILDLLRQDPGTLVRQGRQNFQAATAYPMSEVAQIYVDLIREILN